MHQGYRSYDILNNLDPALLDSVQRDSSLEPMVTPYKKTVSIIGEDLYEPIDVVFYNTKEFSKVGEYFLKHGVYTHLHPVYDKAKFDAFWDEEERRRKEGITLPCSLVQKADGQWVLQDLHITGLHYGYLNYGPIKRLKEKTLITIADIIARGEEIPEEVLSDDKETTFPAFFDSDYYYFKALELARRKGKHIVCGKARRKGYSYKNGWLCADRADLYRNTVTGIGAYDSGSLYPEGTMTMADNYLQHLAANTDWAKRRLIDSQSTIKFGYKLNDGLGIERGYKSSIIAKSFATNNPGALRGKDCTVMLLEESGKNVLLRQVLDSTLPTLKAGPVITGLMIVFGTGGGDTKQWEAFEDLFYTPSADGFLCFNNIWDEDMRGNECGFFMPSFMGKEGFVDKHGNSNVFGAIKYEQAIREKKKRGKAENYIGYLMEEPFTPSEAFSRDSSGIFPGAELEEQLRRVQRDPDIKALARTGNLVRTSKGVVFKDKLFMTPEELKHYHPPITNFPLKRDDDAHGCFIMWSPPYRSKITTNASTLVGNSMVKGEVPPNLYRIWHDPYAISKDTKDVSSRDSLGVFYVYEKTNNFTPGFGDRIVAEFRGRPSTTDEFNDIMFAAAEYYNAIIMFESNRGDVKEYARRNKLLHKLADEPEVIWKKALQTSKGNNNKGIVINEARKLDGVIYLKDWLTYKRGKGEFKQESLNLHYIYSETLLKELLRFNLVKGNFDGVSTAIVGMYDTKEQFFVKVEEPAPIKEGSSVFHRDLF